MTERKCSILIILGFVVSVLSTLAGGVKIYDLDLYLCNAAFITFAALYPFDRTRIIIGALWCLSVGAMLHGLVFLGLKHESPISAWSGFGVSSVILIAFLVLYHLSQKKLKPPSLASSLRFNNKRIATFASFAALTIVAFRVMDAMLEGIPNEQRSIMLLGVEFHHINFGIITLLAVDMLGYSRHQGNNMLVLLVVGVGLGMLIDQSVYFALAQITDESYRSQTSLWGAIIVYIFCAGVWFWHTAKKVS